MRGESDYNSWSVRFIYSWKKGICCINLWQKKLPTLDKTKRKVKPLFFSVIHVKVKLRLSIMLNLMISSIPSHAILTVELGCIEIYISNCKNDKPFWTKSLIDLLYMSHTITLILYHFIFFYVNETKLIEDKTA